MSRAEMGQPQEPQHSDPKGEVGPTGPARGVPLYDFRADRNVSKKNLGGGEFEGRGCPNWSRETARMPPLIAFFCTTFHMVQRSSETSPARRYVRSCSGLIGVLVSPSTSPKRSRWALSARICRSSTFRRSEDQS